jgi:Tol biopolymer transport system component
MEWFGGTNFGNEVTIADPPGTPPTGFRAYYPAFSPDGRWIAFNTSKGDAYDDTDSQLWLADADGANPPLRLRKAAPEGVNTNSWPRWGPLPDDDILWLTFASRRPYGRVTQGFNPQIWVTAIDPTQAEAGEDPSFSSFWLPGQETNTSNHIPMWVP